MLRANNPNHPSYNLHNKEKFMHPRITEVEYEEIHKLLDQLDEDFKGWEDALQENKDKILSAFVEKAKPIIENMQLHSKILAAKRKQQIKLKPGFHLLPGGLEEDLSETIKNYQLLADKLFKNYRIVANVNLDIDLPLENLSHADKMTALQSTRNSPRATSAAIDKPSLMMEAEKNASADVDNVSSGRLRLSLSRSTSSSAISLSPDDLQLYSDDDNEADTAEKKFSGPSTPKMTKAMPSMRTTPHAGQLSPSVIGIGKKSEPSAFSLPSHSSSRATQEISPRGLLAKFSLLNKSRFTSPFTPKSKDFMQITARCGA
jgi:hypothetical protein